MELLQDRAELIVLPPPCPLTVQPIDFGHADELISRGYEGARDYLDNLPADGGPAIPFSFSMHSHE